MMKTENLHKELTDFRSIPLLFFYHFLRSALPKTCFRTVTTPVIDQTGNNLRTPMPHDVEKVKMN